MTFLKNSHLIGGAIGGAIEGLNDHKTSGIIGGTMGGIINELTERQIEILKLIEKDNKISYRAVAEKLKINRSATQEHFEALKSKSIIERIGGTRGYWKINYEKKTVNHEVRKCDRSSKSLQSFHFATSACG